MTTMEDSVVVLIDGEELIIDRENLCDISQLSAAEEVAKKAGKRLMTRWEYKQVAKLPSRWDADLKGRWFTFETPGGEPVEIFFPAEGSISTESGEYDRGKVGRYWGGTSHSESYKMSRSKSYYHFFHFNKNDASGEGAATDYHLWLSVRCVRDNNTNK